MKEQPKKRREIIFHPFLLSLYVFITIFSATILDLPIRQSIPAFLLSVIIPGFFLFLFFKITKELHRAGILSSLVIIFLFYYGSIYRALQSFDFSGLHLGINTILFPLWCFIFLLFFWATTRSKLSGKRIITTYLNIVSILIFANPAYMLMQGIPLLIQDPLRNWQPAKQESLKEFSLFEIETNDNPDIYYIILDGYGRQDILEEIYNYDNSEFITYLQEQGFFVAVGSQTNYIKTSHSLSSSLNLKYHDDLGQYGKESSNRKPLRSLISQNELSEILRNFGYKTISFDTGHYYTKIQKADMYFNIFYPITEFDEAFLSFTVATLLNDNPKNKVPLLTYQVHRSRTQFILNRLKEMPYINGPKFVFVHLILPHPPFVYDDEGNPIDPKGEFNLNDADDFKGTREEYKSGYVDQVIYVNRLLKEIIPTILEESSSPPVIVIQGDHGPRMLIQFNSLESSCVQEAASILNAYYFPDGIYSELYDTISPVNTFRVVLNKYFQVNLSLLEDRTYFSNYTLPYNYIDITEKAKKPCKQ